MNDSSLYAFSVGNFRCTDVFLVHRDHGNEYQGSTPSFSLSKPHACPSKECFLFPPSDV